MSSRMFGVFRFGRIGIRPVCCALFPFASLNDDQYDQISEANRKELMESVQEMSGYDRLVAMFRKDDDFGTISPQLSYVYKSTMYAAFIGVCIGGFQGTKKAYIQFTESNQAGIFDNTFEAKKKLQDTTSMGFAKGAWRWSWRLALFTGMFSLFSTTLTVYRGESSMLCFAVPGMLAGMLYKINIGIRGAIVGGVMGLTLGTVFGGISQLIMTVSGYNMNDVYISQFSVSQNRKKMINEAWEKAATEKHNPTSRAHDERLGDKNKYEL